MIVVLPGPGGDRPLLVGLSAAPQAERCGWCVDRWGVSWQVVPHNIAELMADAATREKILQMGKIDLALPVAHRPHHAGEAIAWWLRPEALTTLRGRA